MRSVLTLVLLLASVSPAVAGPPAPPSDAALESAYEATLEEADAAIRKFGVTDSAMLRIQSALARLAARPSLRNPANLQQIHGSPKSNAAVLASRGDDGLTLFLTRFEPGHATPVHDHQTWGVAHVIEGRDHYVHWDVDDAGGGHERAEVRKATGVILVPGGSVYWFPPPHDLHSQEALDGVVWELVLAGKNFLAPGVLGHRHYYDPKTGDVTHMKQK